jgi:enoyl-[acyl-carrier protein] reductase II
MNVALSYVKGTNVIDFVIEQGIKFVTTSSGSPMARTRCICRSWVNSPYATW